MPALRRYRIMHIAAIGWGKFAVFAMFSQANTCGFYRTKISPGFNPFSAGLWAYFDNIIHQFNIISFIHSHQVNPSNIDFLVIVFGLYDL